MLGIKSVKQSCHVESLLPLIETFRRMVNDCIRIGLENDASTLKKLSKLSYASLAKYDIISYYKLHAISKAAGTLANRKQSIRRGYPTRIPYLRKGILVSCYGFKISDGVLKVPLGNRQYFDIQLNKYVIRILSGQGVTVRSFTLTGNNAVSICYSKEIAESECTTIAGVDRNLSNLTVGNDGKVTQYGLSKAVDIQENTRSIVRSFAEIKRQIEYKAVWEGIPIIELSSGQTRGTSQLCPRCGKRLQVDRLRKRELYCQSCDRWLDRDVVAAMNIARNGAEVFQRHKGLQMKQWYRNPGVLRR